MAEKIKTNDVKKGWLVYMKNMGATAQVMDNRRGNLRMIQYLPGQGLFDDIGDEYVFRWALARPDKQHNWQEVELTKEQQQLQKQIEDEEKRWSR